MWRNVSAWHVIVVLVLVLLLFGANRLPGLAKSIGQSMKIFKNEVKDLTDDGRRNGSTTTAAPDPEPGFPRDPVRDAGVSDVPPPPPAAPPAPPRP